MENNNIEIKNREWNLKVFSTPKIPKGTKGMINTINIVLQAIKDKIPIETDLKIEDSFANSNLNYLCIQLRPIGLVRQNYGVWELSDIAKNYLKNKDKCFLAKIFCANIKFFAEAIHYLKEEKTSKQLYDIAINKYKLSWKTKSDINARLTWLKEFNLIDYNDYKLTYILNQNGLKFAENIQYTDHKEIKVGIDKTLEIKKINITSFDEKLFKLTNEELENRKENIGYIPGNIENFCNTISEYIQLTANYIDIKDIYKFSKENYGITASSTAAFLKTLNSMDFVNHKSRYTLKASNDALKWNEKKDSLELLCWINKKFIFIFEILFELNNKNLTNKELASIAKVYYGYKKVSINEIRKRIKMLLINDLIMEDSLNTYTITNKGKLLLNKICVQERKENRISYKEKNKQVIEKSDSIIGNKILEMRIASRDSSNPSRFEKALRDIFEILGFNAKWIGGSGKTDILLKTNTTPKFSYVVAVDAKSSASGSITEGFIDFDTIKEHKKKHEADYNLIIGPCFQGERLIERAKEHNVLLLNIDDLEEIIIENQNIPLSLDSYRKLFSQKGLADIDILKQDRENIKRRGILMQSIMDCLIDESGDKYTEGILTERDLYMTLRSSAKLQFITPDEIHIMLDFLSSPLIGCVEHTKNGYCAIESLSNISKKLEFYSISCQQSDNKT